MVTCPSCNEENRAKFRLCGYCGTPLQAASPPTKAVAEEAVVVHGRCLPYGDGVTFWPLVEIVRGSAGMTFDDPPAAARHKLLALVGEQDVAARIASVVGLATTPYSLFEIDWAARRLLELLAGDRPCGRHHRRHPLGGRGLPRPPGARHGHALVRPA